MLPWMQRVESERARLRNVGLCLGELVSTVADDAVDRGNGGPVADDAVERGNGGPVADDSVSAAVSATHGIGHRLRSIFVVALALGAAPMGCAHDSPVMASRADTAITAEREDASRIYAVAEQRIKDGAYGDATELLRVAILRLPPQAEHDVLRHRLIMRLAYTQLRLGVAERDPAPLVDAQQMLTRYLERHQQLFSAEDPKIPRSEIFEMLYQVETRLVPADEAGPASDEPSVTAVPGQGLEAVALEGTGDDPSARVAAADSAPNESRAARSANATNTPNTTYDDEGNELREVVVKRRRTASISDPAVMAKLRGDFSDAAAGLVLTRPGFEQVHGPRPLVRGLVSVVRNETRKRPAGAYSAGRALLRDVRPQLYECYNQAFAREPVRSLLNAIEVSIHPDGTVSQVQITDGGLIDAQGDECLVEAVQDASAKPHEGSQPVRVRVAMTFIYQNAMYIFESSGEQMIQGGIPLRGNPPPKRGGARIDASANTGR